MSLLQRFLIGFISLSAVAATAAAQEERLSGAVTGVAADSAERLDLHPDASAVVNRPLADKGPNVEAADAGREKTVIDTDREFDTGSSIRIDALSNRQLDNLVLAGEVWGFLKYFHPAITSGTRQWDYELFRWLPRILAASTRNDANRVLADWIDALGPIAACDPCVPDPPAAYVQLPSPTRWIHDEAKLGRRLSAQLVEIYRNRRADTQFYVDFTSFPASPAFTNEPYYEQIVLPDAGFQVLAAYRFWSIIQYWFPYRDMVVGNWRAALRNNLAAIALARDGEAFDRAMLKLNVLVGDSHSNLWSSLYARPPQGGCGLPASIRFVQGVPVVYEILPRQAPGLRRGDVVLRLDGVPVIQLIARWLPYYAGSNYAAKFRDIGRSMSRGACGDTTLDVVRDGRIVATAARRIPLQDFQLRWEHDLPGATFRLFSPDVAYLKLSSIREEDVAGYVQAAQGTKGLIVDLRNYPSDFVAYSLGSAFVATRTQFAEFTAATSPDPGVFYWAARNWLTPSELRYAGKVVVLVDEVSQSQAEFTAMALRVSPRATVLGSTTAGADGDVSVVPLPGQRYSLISGLGIFYPDRSPAQQVGIVPDVFVTPTIRGIREGRDELVESALRQILGNGPSDEVLQGLYR